ncbi:RHS repeat-associated core domain-containing protein [Streptomyces sp. Li-HN-5-11]|uniref:RHS repeat-associated core domain-containing protein n=1 Tax=Streptomyces sp. Li-HN-5-11 TaxID=3075432 RepID=UPI0028A9A2DD|nr:RHS repeat-associated core domain-containing protein [Streptomyces sp. Li-HN-5-11]WNM36795.1 RHS repeat-associated core domain-containing protein [Streptomyces sp. Li-HN-5-11]
MVSTLLVGATPAAGASGNGLPGAPKSERPVPGSNGPKVRPRMLAKGPNTPIRKPEKNWPTPTHATITVPDVSGQSGSAMGLPLRVGPVLTPHTRAATHGAPDRVDARVLGHELAERAGVDGMLFTLTAMKKGEGGKAAAAKADGVDERVSVRVDYRDFAGAFGGGYASRLRLVELPACALTSPAKAACHTVTPVPSDNDTEDQTLTAKSVSLSSSMATVLAATPSTSGAKGDYKATPLSPSATWKTDLNTGDFSWSYGMPVPAVPGGLKPAVGLSYSSGSIDGRTGNTNNQGSWVGDGFDLSPGFIERRYKPCADDGAKNADGNKPGDLCWAYDNAFITFNGKGGELVPTGTDGEYRLKQDDGTKITRLTSSDRGNGDSDGEYWRLTTPDGTRYYFGYNRLPGWADGKPATDSTWTTPVYGNNSGEPCHKDSFADSWCQQAWRWNLDYVVDPHGNAMSYWYGKETNSYGRNLKPDDDTSYTRGGYLKRIDYGLKSARMFADKPLAQVVFTSAERCLVETGVTCDPDTIDDNAFYWYDTPWDLNCKTGTKCDNGRLSPSFWTRKRLTDVTTQVLKTDGTYGEVDSWHLTHRWGMADTDYQLLLESVQHTGHTATPAITLPKTTFTYTQLANRLDKTGDGYAPFIKARLSTIADESGGQVDVNYSSPVCSWDALPTPETNTTRCFPQYIGGDSSDDPERQWFNKYVVTKVTATDRTGGAPDQVTTYDYLDGAAWHFDDDDGLTKEKFKTWSQWRGYGHVRVRTGGEGGASGLKTQTDSYFLRGMDGDRKDKDGGNKSVTVALGENEGDPITDESWAAGFEYKTVTYSGSDGKALAKTVSRPWHHETAKKTRTWGTLTADFTGIDSSTAWTSLDDGAGSKWRTTATKTTHDTVAGRVTQVDDLGDTTTASDDRCTRTTYATNTADNILNLPQRVETVAKACDTSADRSKDVISDVRTAYDGQSYGAAPTKGDVTATATLKSNDATTATYLESGATFDTYGRVLTSTDLTATVTVDKDGAPARTVRKDGRTTTTVYDPPTGWPAYKKVTTPPADTSDASTAQTTIEDLDPLRGLTVKQTDTNGNATAFAYDALGRSSKVWLADRRTSQTPNYEFTYTTIEDKPVAVGTKTLDNSGGQVTSYVIYDGFLRPRQTQAPGPDGGRVLTDTFYDERGLVTKTFADYYATGSPSTELFKPDDALKVETQTRTTYDGLGRVTQVQEVAGNSGGGQVLSTTKTIYGGDRTTVIPPTGGTTTTALTDARGRTTELRQHLTPAPTSEYVATKYTYTPAGEPETISDADGNTWRYSYDQMGRQIETVDPDKGTSTSTYDDRGQLVSSKDARSEDKFPALYYVYDGLGRKTELREGSASGTLRAKWVYDTVAGAKGQLAESTRYVDGQAYTSKVTAYDRLYRAIRTEVVIPASEGRLAGTYQSATAYKPSGLVAGTSDSAAGSLPGGSVNYAYEDQTLRPIKVFGQGMTSATTYSLTGKPLIQQMSLTDGGKKAQVTNSYEWGTQRLANTRVDREEQAGVDRNVSFRYDESGNVLSMSDVSRTGTDTQCFTYDWATRLTEAWTQNTASCATTPSSSVIGGPAPYWNTYTYDQLGNRKTEIQHNTAGDPGKDVKRDYAYFGKGKPQAHALSTLTTTGASGTQTSSYGYDESGNTTVRPGQSLLWDTEGHLVKVTENGKTTAQYVYDADGNRLICRTDAETTLYLGDTEVTLPKGTDKPKATRYINLGGGQMAIRNDDGTFTFTIGDHQGTGQLAIQAGDLEMSQRRSLPFGGTRGPAPKSWPGSKGFVGGTDDTDSTGLTHLGAREYDPASGRFISVDPLMESTRPQSLNGYSYAENNPVTTADPTGLSNQISCDESSCDGESQFKESHNSPDFSTGQTWEDKYPWETSHYDYFDDRVPAGGTSCDLVCSATLDWAAKKTPTITSINGLCGVGTSSGCDAQLRESVKNFYKETSVLDDYYNCTLHHDETACDVAGGAFSSAGGTWAASVFFAFSHNLQERLAIRAETYAGNKAATAAVDQALATKLWSKNKAGLAGVLRVEGREPQFLTAVSGAQNNRKGVVPDVGTPGNPARYNTIPTGNNKRDYDTEYKMLTYIANQLGGPSDVSGSLTMHSTQKACFSCSAVIGQFAQEFPNIRINYTSKK